ncbi:MAG: hypothetical protein ABI347_01940 [Nitrososphaera sp.]|jgi:hypothetical protein
MASESNRINEQKRNEEKDVEPHLKIFKDRSILVKEDGSEIIFREGSPNKSSKERTNKLRAELSKGFLKKIIDNCRSPDISWNITEKQDKIIDKLISGVTSEQGRALMAVTILQLCIKCIDPTTSIRLHKAGRGIFSWEDGLSMRTFNSEYIAPILRSENLLKYNIFGAFMTRSLAENYPYTKFYKASIRGPKEAWLELVDQLEDGLLDPLECLKRVISALINKSEKFILLANETMSLKEQYLSLPVTVDDIARLIMTHVNNSDYAARLFEIAMHSVAQVLHEERVLGGWLRPLSQMRSANKKAGNIGDVEVLATSDPLSEIIEAWDAKYWKPYLYDELGELEDKLTEHKSLRRVGLVPDDEPQIRQDVKDKLAEIEEIYGIRIEIMSFEKWWKEQLRRSISKPDEFGKKWLNAYVESICQKRPALAPIDEPSQRWVEEIRVIKNCIEG